MIYVLVLAYNEQDNIGPLLTEIDHILKRQQEKFEIVVMDDGSLDQTSNIVKRLKKDLPVTLLEHSRNRGVAQAFYTGLSFICAQAKPEDCVITMEGDRTNSPDCLLPMIGLIKRGYDIVSASRYQPGGGYERFPLLRRILSRLANLLAKMVFRIPSIRDYTIFYKAYKANLLQAAFQYFQKEMIELQGFAANTEILLKVATRSPVKCAEVPLRYDYGLKKGTSKMRIFANIKEYFRLFKIVFFRKF